MVFEDLTFAFWQRIGMERNSQFDLEVGSEAQRYSDHPHPLQERRPHLPTPPIFPLSRRTGSYPWYSAKAPIGIRLPIEENACISPVQILYH